MSVIVKCSFCKIQENVTDDFLKETDWILWYSEINGMFIEICPNCKDE